MLAQIDRVIHTTVPSTTPAMKKYGACHGSACAAANASDVSVIAVNGPQRFSIGR